MQEPNLPYDRPALSKGYLQPVMAPRVPEFHTPVATTGETHGAAWYRQNKIEVIANTWIDQVDLRAKTLTSCTGLVYAYNTLVIATGQRPTTLKDLKMPGAELEGIVYLRGKSGRAAGHSWRVLHWAGDRCHAVTVQAANHAGGVWEPRHEATVHQRNGGLL